LFLFHGIPSSSKCHKIVIYKVSKIIPMPKKMYKELIELIEKQSIGKHVTPSVDIILILNQSVCALAP
jgi:hypothetical protein